MFDPFRAAAELVASQRETTGPKLSFPDKCAAFAAMKAGVKPRTIAKAFGISSAAASQLATCEQPGGRVNRYPKVRQEFERLGDRLFMEHYYTDAVHTRIQRIKHGVEEVGDIRTRNAPSPIARSKSFSDIGTFFAGGEHWQVDWRENEPSHIEGQTLPSGWYASHCELNGDPVMPGGYMWQGMERLSGGDRCPFRTAPAAYNAIMSSL